MKKVDKGLIIACTLLSIFGIIMIYSASFVWAEYKFDDPFRFSKMQSIFLLLGIIVMFIISKINYKFYEKKSSLITIIGIILLVLVLIPGIGIVRNGSRSWFGIGSLGIQPSEFVKLGLIIFSAKYLARNKINSHNEPKHIFPLLGIIFLNFTLIMLEPDFGSGSVMVLTNIVLIFAAGVKLSFFVKIGMVGLLGVAGLIVIAPYRLARIISFLNPWSDPLGSGFQIIQSLYAIGPGGLLGQGFLSSRQKSFYLPEPQTDFIFSIISEEFGFLGVLIVTGFFFFIFYRIVKISLRQTDLFAKYLSFGIGIAILVQALLNLFVVIGILPVTGVTLPFLSYGGSSLLISLASIGIILNISKK